MPLEFAKRIERIPVYPAASGYGRAGELTLLASNESPYGPLEPVKQAIVAAAERLNRYPDPTNALLRKRLSDRYDVPASRIAIGNGSCDILLAAGEALLEEGAELIYAWPSFSVYPHLAAASGARAIVVPLDGEERHDLAAMAREITVATRLVIVCNPNNPTSTALPLASIEAFLAEVPAHACVILDEAYCEFNLLDDPDASIDLLRAHPNLLLLRTFSKVHALCGLRVGYALCGSERMVQALDQVRQPFFCNALAQAAATEALAHQDAIAERVARTIAERISVGERLAALGLRVADSQANFCWVALPGAEAPSAAAGGPAARAQEAGADAAAVEQRILSGLAERGIMVRAGSDLGRAGHLRASYGTSSENERFLSALEELLPAPAG